MRESARECIAVLFVSAILVLLAVLCGFTPDGLLNGHWPDTGDHPENWADTTLHP
ncbi:MAG: hypothetical protein ABSD59_16805 [Terracidiphilus sp.]|jgi:hypothetical protein